MAKRIKQEDFFATDRARYTGYDKIMGNISWLLIALVSLATKHLPSDEQSTLFFLVYFAALLVCNVFARYLVFPRALANSRHLSTLWYSSVLSWRSAVSPVR
jgi:hypothetical protein